MDGQITEIKFSGKTIPLKSEKLRQAFMRIKEQQDSIEKLCNAASKETTKDQVCKWFVWLTLTELHLQMANILDEAEFQINKERKEEMKKNEASG